MTTKNLVRSVGGASQSEAAGRSADVTPRLIEAISPQLGRTRAERYLREVQSVRLNGDVVEVVAPSTFVADLISRRIGTHLCRAASAAFLDGRPAELRIRIDEPSVTTSAGASELRPATPAAPPRPKPSLARTGESLRSLDDFIVGQTNRLAYSAAVRLAEDAGIDTVAARTMYRPLLAGTVANLGLLPPAHALTGAVRRGDLATIKAHLAALGRSDRALYRELGRRALALARRHHLDPERIAAMADLLADREKR